MMQNSSFLKCPGRRLAARSRRTPCEASRNKFFLGAAFALMLLAAPARADLITWGGGVGNQFFTSGGSSLDVSFWFELGTFGSFVPTAVNRDDWAANWQVFDRATTTGAGSSPQWDPGLSVLAGSANITTTGATSKAADLVLPPSDPNYISIDPLHDFRGQLAYLWVFNDRRTNVSAEWGLFTGITPPVNLGDPSVPWAFPVTVDLDCGCSGLGADFNLANINTDILGSSSQSTNDDSTQTVLNLAAVPEPGTAVLLLAFGAFLLMRSRRLIGGAR